MTLCKQSLDRLDGVHESLRRVTLRAAEMSPVPFAVTEGLRSPERQARLREAGASRTEKSRHLTGHAIDIVPIVDGQPCWKWPAFTPVARAFKAAAHELGVPIVWGGDWRRFRDGPHIELNRRAYPAQEPRHDDH